MPPIDDDCKTAADVLARIYARAKKPTTPVVRLPLAALAANPDYTRGMTLREKRRLSDAACRAAIMRMWGHTNEGIIQALIALSCTAYDIAESDFYSRERKYKQVMARHIVYYLARRYTRMSLPEIAKRVGKKDHTTVLSGIRRVDRLIEKNDEALIAQIADIREQLETLMPFVKGRLPPKEKSTRD